MVCRTNETTGSEQSRPDDQRRTVEASGTRSASFSLGEAFSHEQCSLKRRHNAWQRANKLKWLYGRENSGRKVKVLAQLEQRPRRIPIQSWCSSCACLRRRPCPTIESCSQTGHRRKMISSESSAQPAASCSGPADTGTKRIVTSKGLRRRR